jgi:glyoxylase-like metal-dependent hydrolase (beta-lactamase superfamily II)
VSALGGSRAADAAAELTTSPEREAELLAARGIVRVRAPNPGALTLSGTNTWVVGRDPAWIVDPGPLLEEHVDAVGRALEVRGGLGGVVLTHAHSDHSDAVAALLERHPAPLAAGAGECDVVLREGVRFGPFQALATPGHAEDHFALLAADALFSGDAVLGEGSVFVSPYRGSMSAYLLGLERLSERKDFTLVCPGHGPVIADGHARIGEYRAHRLRRESDLLEALAQGRRTVGELLEAVWWDAPAALRPAAAATLEAHLDKLEQEGRLPDGVERPRLQWLREGGGAP